MVSIIIPCYNGEKFIDRCFNSILNQSYKNLEVILVNDGSVDKSESIIKEKIKIFKKFNIIFKYIYQENKGLGGAINTGLKYVTGEFITLLDIDDYIMPNSIELKVKFLKENKDFDIVRTNGYYVTEENLDDDTKLFITNEIEKKQIYIFNDLVEAKTNNWAGSYMVRTSKLFDFYKDKNIYETRYGQNLQILMPISYNSKCGFIDKPLMKYINQKNSLSKHSRDFLKEKICLLGYKDIRVNVIKKICKDDELKKYLDKIEILYARCFMELAFSYRNKELMNSNFEILRRYKVDTIEDKILYYNLNNKIIEIILRIIKKIL